MKKYYKLKNNNRNNSRLFKRYQIKFDSDHNAVSEALGTILLLAIAMSLIGLVYAWVTTLPAPEETIEVEFKASIEIVSGQRYISIEHRGGERINIYQTEVGVQINDITMGVYALDKYNIPSFSNDFWEVGETWSRNINSLYPDWNTSTPKVEVQVTDIDTDTILHSQEVRLGGDSGNLPDLLISEEEITFRFLNATVKPGDWVNVSTRIRNIGDSDAVNVIVRFFDVREIIPKDDKDYIFINSIPVNSYRTISVNWTPEYSGARTINIKAYSNQIEKDFSNNFASKKLEIEPILPEITGPNLEIEGIAFTPETPTHGEWVTISVFVKNVGDEALPSGSLVNISIWDENGYVLTRGVYYNFSRLLTSELTIFETLLPAYTYNAQTLFGGTTTIYTEVSTNVIESRYNDNRLYAHLQILPTILLVDDDGVYERYTRDDASSYMDASLQLAVGSGQFDIYTIKGPDGPKYSTGDKPLINYDIVIWVTGYQTSNTLSNNDLNTIKQYLDNHGKLWLIGMNILPDISGNSSFIFNYLGVDRYNVTGTPEFLYGVKGENITEGMRLNTSNILKSRDNGVNLTLRSSVLNNHSIDGILGNDQFFGQTGNMSLKYYNQTLDFKLVYFGWEFASIIDMINRNNLTIQILKWFGWELEVGTDLAISSKGFDNQNPKFMDWITITATIRNNGPRDLAGVRVDFFVIDTDGTEQRISEYPGFENIDNPQFIYIPGSGAERLVQKKWLAVSVGQHTFRVVVDLEDEIDEVSEENNDDFYSPLFVTQLYIGYTILVVDDDNSTNNGGNYPNSSKEVTDSLDKLGYIYDMYYTNGSLSPGPGPNITVMKHYNAVIWCTGYDSNYTLLDEDREHLSYYLTRTNFSEADFLGDTRFNAWIIGQGILDDLGGSGSAVLPPTTSFIYQFLKVRRYSTVNPNLPNYLDGAYKDNITHGISYPMIDSVSPDETDTITPINSAYGIFWHDEKHTEFNALRFNNSIHNLIFMPWVFSLINDTTTTKYAGESYKGELSYLIMRWFRYPDVRYEIKTSKIDIRLSNYDPMLGGSYVIKTNIYNLGINNTNVIVRFLDGETIINTKSIFVPANGNSSTEVIWSPLFAGYRNIHVKIDPDNDIPEVFNYLNNNATWANQLVYFFYDDMENGTGNWWHDSTIIRINGESSLDFINNPVYSNVNSTWDYSMSQGFIKNTSEYHSYSSSFYTIEPEGFSGKRPLDIVLVLDTSGSMNQEINDLRAAARAFVNNEMLDGRDRVSIYIFNNEAPYRIQDFTSCNESGKQSLITTINGLTANGYTPLWDTIGEGAMHLVNNGSSRQPFVIAFSDGEDYGEGPWWSHVRGYEDGSEDYCPWHNWTENSQGKIEYRAVDGNGGHDHYGRYAGSWSWENIDNSNDHRWGLLNIPDITVYTIGYGLEHDNYTGTSSNRFPNGWWGEYAQYENGLNRQGDYYNESGTTEFNLWRVANTSGGQYFYTADSSELDEIFETIAGQIVEEVEVERSTSTRSTETKTRSVRARARATIFSDDFESGDFTGGPWSAGAGWSVSTSNPYAGTYHARGTGSMTSSVALNTDLDLSSYNDVKLELRQYTYNVEDSDDCYIDVSTNSGSSWTNVRHWLAESGLETGNYRRYEISLSSYDGSSTFRIRFRFTMSSGSEGWDIDNVVIRGNLSGGGTSYEQLLIPGDRNLTTHPFSLVNTTSAKLSFYHKYNLRGALNGVVILVGTPDTSGSGWNFEYALPTQPYTGNIWIFKRMYDDYGNEMRWCWNGVSGFGRYTWDYVEVDLTNWTGLDQVRIRISFLWAGAGDGGGYYIDDFKVSVTRNETLFLTQRSIDQWDFTSSNSHSGDHCWWNHNFTTNHLSGGLDNSLYTRPIDITNARNATLSAYFKFNINTASGRPPDGFRVEISADNGVTWKAINMGARSAWGISNNGTDNDDGLPNDGKSYSGLDRYGSDKTRDGWVEASTLTRLNTDISGWAGNVIILRFRVVTASDNNPYFRNRHYEDISPSNNAYGLMIDDVIIYGFSLLD